MDFMKWLNSLDEFLYEVMSWLIFFPLTLWRSITKPIETMRTVGQQAAVPEEQQFADLLSPPLFLTLGLLLSHGVSMALGQTDALVANRHGLAAVVTDSTSALMLRVIVFASIPLFLAARLVRRSGVPLSRITLQQPFYEQCFPGSVLALGISLGTSLTVAGGNWGMIGAGLVISSLVYFFVVETRWFAVQGDGRHGRAAASVTIGFLEGMLFVIVVGYVFTR